MPRRLTSFLVTAAFLCAGCAHVSVAPVTSEVTEPSSAAWSYDGVHGPERWSDAYPECAGTAQSPIDLSGAEEAELDPIEFTYVTVGGQVIDTSYAVHVASEGGALQIGDRLSTLLELHFHVPSEHTIEGERFDAAMHLVHAEDDTQLVVVALPLVLGDENDLIDDVIEQLDVPVAAREEVDIEDLDLEAADYYTYYGSMTTPPCPEGVRWIILSEPATLSEDQLAALEHHSADNVRPLQETNDRTILRTSQ